MEDGRTVGVFPSWVPRAAGGEEAAIQQFLPDLQEITQSEDIKEGIQSFIERRQANFIWR